MNPYFVFTFWQLCLLRVDVYSSCEILFTCVQCNWYMSLIREQPLTFSLGGGVRMKFEIKRQDHNLSKIKSQDQSLCEKKYKISVP